MRRLWCGSRYNAWTCDREPGHPGKHQSGNGITWSQPEATKPPASELDANPARGHTAEVVLDDYLTSESLRGLKSLATPSYAAMLRAVKIDRLSTTAPENEGVENRFHRAGCERIPQLEIR